MEMALSVQRSGSICVERIINPPHREIIDGLMRHREPNKIRRLAMYNGTRSRSRREIGRSIAYRASSSLLHEPFFTILPDGVADGSRRFLRYNCDI